MSEETQTAGQPQIVSGAMLRQLARPHITNPVTGNTYHVRRLVMADVVAAGGLPDEYVALMEEQDREAERGEGEGEAATDDDLSVRESLVRMKAGAIKIRVYVTAVLINPRIVDDPKADDEIAYSDLPESDRVYIFKWARASAGEAPVELAEGGATTAGQLETFSDGERADEPHGAGRLDESVGAAGV